LIHEWVGLLITAVAVASLASTAWSIAQNVYFFECLPPPPDVKETMGCPGLIERVGWNIPGLFVSCVVLVFGLWTYEKGKKGVPLVSIE